MICNPPVLPAASVGAIGLCSMVATGNPHPLHKGALLEVKLLDCKIPAGAVGFKFRRAVITDVPYVNRRNQ